MKQHSKWLSFFGQPLGPPVGPLALQPDFDGFAARICCAELLSRLQVLRVGGAGPALRIGGRNSENQAEGDEGTRNVGNCELFRHPHPTIRNSFYVETSGARDRAELVTDDATEIRAQLEAVTGKRIAPLEGIGEMERAAPEKAAETQLEGGRRRARGAVHREGSGRSCCALEGPEDAATGARKGRWNGTRVVTECAGTLRRSTARASAIAAGVLKLYYLNG